MGSGNNDAQRAAERSEAQRQAQIAAGTAEANRIFADPARAAQIADVEGATREYLTDDLNRQKRTADRQTKFAMARGSLAGGSAASDAGKRLGEDYVRGQVETERRIGGVGADIRQQDRAAQQSILAMIQSGADMNTAATQSAMSLRNNLGTARAQATERGIGDMFGSFANIWKSSQEGAARRQAEKYAYNTIYQSGIGGQQNRKGG